MNKVLDFTKKDINVSLLMFSDDTAPIVSAKTTELLLSNTIQKISVWMKHRKGAVNCNKSIFVIFGRSGNYNPWISSVEAGDLKKKGGLHVCYTLLLLLMNHSRLEIIL